MAKPVTATYESEDLEITFSAVLDFVSDDPSEGDIDNITMEDVKICGISWPLRDMPMAIRNALFDKSTEIEWDTE